MSGRILRNMFDRFDGNWQLSLRDNQLSFDSFNVVIKSVLRRATEMHFDPKIVEKIGISKKSKLSKDIIDTYKDLPANMSYENQKIILEKKLDEVIGDMYKSLNKQSKKISGSPNIKKYGDVRDEEGGIEIMSFTIRNFKKHLSALFGIPASQMNNFLEELDKDAR